jgi:hypothetical protein
VLNFIAYLVRPAKIQGGLFEGRHLTAQCRVMSILIAVRLKPGRIEERVKMVVSPRNQSRTLEYYFWEATFWL